MKLVCHFIYPFRDGKGRVSRRLKLPVLSPYGYEVGCYISLERLAEARRGWRQSKVDSISRRFNPH